MLLAYDGLGAAIAPDWRFVARFDSDASCLLRPAPTRERTQPYVARGVTLPPNMRGVLEVGWHFDLAVFSERASGVTRLPTQRASPRA